jgi:hypothetical protein
MSISDAALGIDRWRLLGANLRSREIFEDLSWHIKPAINAARFMAKKARGRHSKAEKSSNLANSGQKGFICFRYGEKCHKKSNCANEGEWATYTGKKKSRVRLTWSRRHQPSQLTLSRLFSG